MIMLNSIRCKNCNDVVVSKHRHDWVTCKCGDVFADGGKDYLRRGHLKPNAEYEELSIDDTNV